MRIGFFGGSFDPPHCAHLAIASAAMERLHLDEVLMAPAGRQPLKETMRGSSSFEERLTMVRLATQGDPRLIASTIDAPREDGRANYTIDSLSALRSTLAADDELFCLVGADSFLTMRKWYRAADLLLLVPFIVAGRPGFSLEDAAAALPNGLHAGQRTDQEEYASLRIADDAGHSGELYLMPDLSLDISATQIRNALDNGAAAESLLPRPVLAYIRERGLYR